MCRGSIFKLYQVPDNSIVPGKLCQAPYRQTRLGQEVVHNPESQKCNIYKMYIYFLDECFLPSIATTHSRRPGGLLVTLEYYPSVSP